MANDVTESKLMQVLDWTYEKAVNGIAGLDSAQEMAEEYLKGDGSLRDRANSLIRWQNTRRERQASSTGSAALR